MTELNRIRVVWEGFPGGPGVSTFYGLVAGASLAALRAYFYAMVGCLPNTVSIDVQEFGDVIESTTGALVGSWSGDAQAIVAGTSNGAYPAPCGIAVTWETDTFVDNHRLKGRTFLVPMSPNVYATDGTIASDVYTSMQAWAETLAAAVVGDLVIWHRPRAARAADGSRPAVAARAGSHGLITGSSVRDKVVVLRSRRD